jgi:hypothetical protein
LLLTNQHSFTITVYRNCAMLAIESKASSQIFTQLSQLGDSEAGSQFINAPDGV